MQVLPDASRSTLNRWVSTLVVPGAVVYTDRWSGYGTLTSAGYDHRPRLQRRDHPDRQKLLPGAHRAASNLKTWLQGTHHGVSPEHLRVYLDEFVFRHNRRRTPMAAFQTLLGPAHFSQIAGVCGRMRYALSCCCDAAGRGSARGA